MIVAHTIRGSMISRDLLRKEFDHLPELYRGRAYDPKSLAAWGELDVERRQLLTQVEAARAEKNQISEKVGELRRTKQDASELQGRSKELTARISSLEESLKALDARFVPIEETLPNVPHASVPEGADETLRHQYTADPAEAPVPVPATVGLGTAGAAGAAGNLSLPNGP